MGTDPATEADRLAPISVLFLSPKWQFDTYGVASLVRSMANDLWLTDPDGKRIQMTCAVLQEEGRINSEDVEDAKKHNVTLKGVELPRSAKQLPTEDVLNAHAVQYYNYLFEANDFKFIVGHIPYIVHAALSMRDFSSRFKKPCKVILLAHALPCSNSNDVDGDLLQEWLEDTDVIFSIGQGIYANVQQYIECLEEMQRPIHKTYIPGCRTELLSILRDEQGESVVGPQNINVMTTERKDLSVSGIDYTLAVSAATLASENIHLHSGIQAQVKLLVLTAKPEERDYWKEELKTVRDKQPVIDKRLGFQFQTVENVNKLKSVMRISKLALLPLKPASCMFGVEALMAAYSGVPILVSSNSGIAFLLESIGLTEAVVHGKGNPKSDGDLWSERIIQKIGKPKSSQRCAEALRKELLLDTTIAESHVRFIRTISYTVNQELVVGLDPAASVLAESLAAAKKFGVKVETEVESNEYIAAFLNKLLLQREKLDLGLLDSYLPTKVKDTWIALQRSLEDQSRRVLGVTARSLHFMLFCPTTESYQQLKNETWRPLFMDKLTKFVRSIGVSASGYKILHPPMDEQSPQNEHLVLPAFSRLRLGDKPDDRTSGYGTISSDQGSTIPPEERVRGWLTREELDRLESDAESSDWILDHMIDSGCCDPESPRVSGLWFSVGTSSLGVVFGRNKPNESIVSCVSLTEPHDLVTLSPMSDKVYEFPVSLTVSGREHVAAHCYNDASIRLLDVEKPDADRIVYRTGAKNKYRVLFVIDDDTVGYGDIYPTDGTHHVYLLNTSAVPWSLRSTLRLQLGLKGVDDICYTRRGDGTPSLVIFSINDGVVLMVDVVRADIVWRVGAQQIGQHFAPFSVCSDSEGNIYVSDGSQQRVLLLSSEDGSVMCTVLTTRQHGIIRPYHIRMRDDCLYVSHINNREEKKWIISKFKRN